MMVVLPMPTLLNEHEALIRLGCFFGVLVLLALWEAVAPRRKLSMSKPLRWFSNFGLSVINLIAVRVAFALGAAGIALVASERAWGLFNNVALPCWLAIVLSVVALDFLIYLQHVLFHAIPLFWRLHMVHHADLDFDVSTGLRFHTIEILLSMGIKAGGIILLGAPAASVLIFEVLLNATSMFNHSNIRMPAWVDRILRFLVVTPDMHRVHHSAIARETNSNFGFNLPWWDYLFGTYRQEPSQGHQAMMIGLHQFRDRRAERLDKMLTMPFGGDVGQYPINASNSRNKNSSMEKLSH